MSIHDVCETLRRELFEIRNMIISAGNGWTKQNSNMISVIPVRVIALPEHMPSYMALS